MIVCSTRDSLLQQALAGAAHPEEEVVADPERGMEALQLGYPRLLVRTGSGRTHLATGTGVRVLDLDDMVLRRWERERRAEELLAPRLDYLTRRLVVLVERSSSDRVWVDGALAELGRAAGAPLPFALRAFGRRVMEFPSGHTTLHDVAEGCDTTRGALKARFRRRGLASPYTYLRWFRTLSVAHVLSDGGVTVARAAHRLGFTSAGNLCRGIEAVAGVTPTDLRRESGRKRLVARFAWAHLTSEALDGWATLAELFERRVA